MRSNSSRRSGPSASVAIPSSRTRSTRPLQVGQVGDLQQAAALEGHAVRAARARSAARCPRSHGTAPNCSACVVSCSATQRRSWSGSASSCAGGVAEVGRDEQQPRGRLGVEHRELVLAEHAAGEEAGERAGLGGQQRAQAGADDARRAGRARRRGGRRPGRARPSASARFASAHSSRPTASATGSGARRHEAGVGGDEPLALLGGAVEGLERRGIAGGLQARDPAGDLGGEGPVDHPPMVAGVLKAQEGVRPRSCA